MVLQNFHAVQNVELSSPTKASVGVAAAGAAAITRVRVAILLRGSRPGGVGRVPRARVANQDLLCLDAVATAAVGRTGINSMAVVDATTDCVAFDYLDTHDGKGNGSRLIRKRKVR